MSRTTSIIYLILFCFNLCFLSCETPDKQKQPVPFSYQQFKDSLRLHSDTLGKDSSNVFDSKGFVPGKDSVNTFLEKVDTQMHRDERMMEQMDSLISRLKKVERSRAEADQQIVRENIRILDSFLLNQRKKDSIRSQVLCRKEACRLYMHVNKEQQKLFLYIDGVMKDSFAVSTGMKKYTTPNIDTRPGGPVLAKYTSRKFPGGNYKGLGNMPYAVFVRGGYALHGTTPGNFSKLGTIASHGCIRLHPDNARVIYELVRLFGLENTWVTVD